MVASPMIATRRRLENAIARSRRAGRPGYRVAADAGVHPTTLHGIVVGRINPTDDERARIAAALDEDEAALFGEESSA
jgi:hypothetical protein